MRTLTIFTLFILLNLSSIAQEGNYYRFKVTVQLKDNSELTGYIYTNRLKNFLDYSENQSFSEFVEREIGYPLTIYKEIIDINHSRSYYNHFSLDSKLLQLDQTELLEITLLEKDLYSEKPRLVILNKREYELLQRELKLSITINNSNDTEECFVTFLFFVDKLDVLELKNDILPIIEQLDSVIPFEKRVKFINRERKMLLEKGIVVFELCE